jgi:hypothetical protein
MPNLIIMNKNVASRAALSAAPVAPGMSIAAILNDTKSHVCRAVGTEIEIIMTWTTAERIGGVHFPWCNGSPSTTIEVLGYSDEAGFNKVLETGVRLACPARARELLPPWTPVSAASAYAWGGGAHAFTWFNNTSVRRLVIRVKDSGSLQGYLELSRVFVGEAFSPDENASYDPARTPVSTTTPFYTDAGDRRSVKGTKRWKLSIELGSMTERDRAFVCDMQVANDLDGPSIIDLYPSDLSHERARDHRIYGALVQTSAMRRPNFAQHATTLEWESM